MVVTHKCRTCEYRTGNKCGVTGNHIYVIDWDRSNDQIIRLMPIRCPLKGMRNEERRG